MTALDDVRRSVAQVPRSTPVTVIIAHAGDDEVFNLDTGALADALGIATVPPREWAMLLGDPDGKTYPPEGWTRTNWRGAPYTLNGRESRHTGDDLNKPGETDRGEPCFAVREGQVIFAQRIIDGTWGNLLVIRHKDNDGTTFYSRYGHLDAFRVLAGQTVAAGQWVGNVGRTGSERGGFKESHAHFDITNPGDTTLEKLPTHWPWTDLATIKKVYADPGSFLLARIVPKQEGKWQKVEIVSPNGLIIRAEPTTAGLRKAVLPANVVVEIAEYSVKANGYTWSELRDGRGWIAREFVRPFELPVPKPPTIPKPANLLYPRIKPLPGVIGMHIIGWVPEIVPMAERLAQAGKPIPGFMIADEEKMVAALKKVSPRSFIAFRSTAYPDGLPITLQTSLDEAYRLGQQRAREVLPLLMARAPEADAYKLANEWKSKDDPALLRLQCQADIGMMDVANGFKQRIIIGDFNSGQPQTERPEIRAALHPMLSQAQREGHLLNHHVYTQPGTTDIEVDRDFVAMRWLDLLARDYPDLQAVTGEIGFSDGNAAYAGWNALKALVLAFRAMVRGRDSDRLIMADLYTLTQHAWRQSDFLRDLGLLEELLKGV